MNNLMSDQEYDQLQKLLLKMHSDIENDFLIAVRVINHTSEQGQVSKTVELQAAFRKNNDQRFDCTASADIRQQVIEFEQHLKQQG